MEECVVGKKYSVNISDCCVELCFQSVITAIDIPDDGYGSACDITFANGVQLTRFKVQLFEVD